MPTSALIHSYEAASAREDVSEGGYENDNERSDTDEDYDVSSVPNLYGRNPYAEGIPSQDRPIIRRQSVQQTHLHYNTHDAEQGVLGIPYEGTQDTEDDGNDGDVDSEQSDSETGQRDSINDNESDNESDSAHSPAPPDAAETAAVVAATAVAIAADTMHVPCLPRGSDALVDSPAGQNTDRGGSRVLERMQRTYRAYYALLSSSSPSPSVIPVGSSATSRQQFLFSLPIQLQLMAAAAAAGLPVSSAAIYQEALDYVQQVYARGLSPWPDQIHSVTVAAAATAAEYWQIGQVRIPALLRRRLEDMRNFYDDFQNRHHGGRDHPVAIIAITAVETQFRTFMEDRRVQEAQVRAGVLGRQAGAAMVGAGRYLLGSLASSMTAVVGRAETQRLQRQLQDGRIWMREDAERISSRRQAETVAERGVVFVERLDDVEEPIFLDREDDWEVL